jgi:general stress protein 26
MENTQTKLAQVVESFDSAMLVTRAGNGELHARPMGLADVEADDTDLWFATGMSSKVDELLGDPNVVVTLQGKSKFATISGKARLVRDRATIDAKWKESWKVWFPDGKDDPNLCLIKVEATRGEFWDLSGTKGVRYLWEAAKALVQGKRPEGVPGGHGDVQVR